MYRIYGNGPTLNIAKALASKITIYKAWDIRDEGYVKGKEDNALWLTSPTINNNKAILRPIWTDHRLKPDDLNRISIAVKPTPMAIYEG
jgi:hypothetical protein